ncbi:MAG: Gx transporter family protein [Eubacteriales bacterium]
MSNKETKNRITFGKLILISILVAALFTLERFLLGGITKAEGVKIGLYNMFIVFAIVNMKTRHAYLFFIVKIITSIFLVTQVIFYPLAGGILSIAIMALSNKIFKNKIGYVGISVIGALVYNITIHIIATISLQTSAVFYSIPIVLFLSVVYGTLTGSFAFVIDKTNLLRLGYGERNE